MGNPLLSYRFALVLSLSVAASYTSSYFNILNLNSFSSIPSETVILQATARAEALALKVLSLLGTPTQAALINATVADELKACFKFLAPFPPVQPNNADANRMAHNERIWHPPAPVMELAQLAVESGGDKDHISRHIDTTMLPVPDIEGANAARCSLAGPSGTRFINEDFNSYLGYLFKMIAARSPEIGANVTLNRYDLFHGHLFLATGTGRLGIIFHAKEYPTYDNRVFQIPLGFCQSGSTVPYDNSMNLRNILWLAPLPSEEAPQPGVLVVLDASPGGIVYRDLINSYLPIAIKVRTIYEGHFGDVVGTINYLNVAGEGEDPDYKIFISN